MTEGYAPLLRSIIREAAAIVIVIQIDTRARGRDVGATQLWATQSTPVDQFIPEFPITRDVTFWLKEAVPYAFMCLR